MGGGSAKPRRKKAAIAGLRYEHARSGPVIQQREKRERPWLVALVALPSATAVIAVMGMVADMWGPEAWGGLAPAWPGGGHGFGLTLGLLMALAVATFVVPLRLVNWRLSKARSLARTALALPGVTALGLLLSMSFASMPPPKRRHRDYGCYSEGHKCWVDRHYPYVWVLTIVVAVGAGLLLLGLYFTYITKNRTPSTSEP